jgi:3-oxoadipate enol-lactonase
VPTIGIERGLSLHYELIGDGPRLLYVSGTGGDLRVRPGVLDTPLAARFRVLAFDQRGLGRSDKPEGPYSMVQYADDAAALLDALDWPDARVIGVSFGGMVAQELALRHPERVRRLALCCTSAGGAGGSSYPLHEIAGLPADERARRQLELADTRRTADWQAANPEIVARLRALTTEAAAVGAGEPRREEGARWQLEARRCHDTFDRLHRIDVPVLLCAGRYDGIAPLANMEAMAQRMAHAELRVFEGGHLFLVQDRTAHAAIADWLAL